MNLNIQTIATDRIKTLEKDGTLIKTIEENIDKAVISAVESAFSDYQFKKAIQDQMKALISPIAADCGLSAYNSFITKHVKAIVQETMREDLEDKITDNLDSILVQKHNGIKLSKLLQEYVNAVNNETDEEEQREREHFTIELDVEKDSFFHIYRIMLSPQPEVDCSTEYEWVISLYYTPRRDQNNDPNAPKLQEISYMHHEGHPVNHMTSLPKRPSKFEALLFNLYFNRTPIELDIENADAIDTRYEAAIEDY